MKIWNKTGSDLYVTTEVGQFMFGGVALWVDRFIKYVVPKLERRPTLMIEIGLGHTVLCVFEQSFIQFSFGAYSPINCVSIL